MKLIFDQGVPHLLRRFLVNHFVDTSAELGWSTSQNGDLLEAAEKAGYDALITTDQNLRYQQNLTGQSLAIVVLRSTSWPKMQQRLEEICQAIDAVRAGDYLEIELGQK
jgi:predicted nuclease of predicted toxin-antitoxin system